MDTTEQRLTRVEEAVGFTDHAVSELNAALIEAHRRIDLLEQQLRALRARVDAGGATPGAGGDDADPAPSPPDDDH